MRGGGVTSKGNRGGRRDQSKESAGEPVGGKRGRKGKKLKIRKRRSNQNMGIEKRGGGAGGGFPAKT